MRPIRTWAMLALAAVLMSACTAETPDTTPNGEQNGATTTEAPNGSGDPPPPPPRSYDDTGPVGSLGRDLLKRDPGKATIEIDTNGTEMTARARASLRDALAEHGRKAVAFASQGTVAKQEVYSDADLRAIAADARDTRSEGDRITIHVLVLEGRHENENVLGVAFNATTFAIFPEQIRGGILSSISYDRFEEAVVIHELGHLFGLVNLTGEGGFHEDPEYPGHSENKESVMFWAVEDISIGNVFRGGPPTTFDADDRAEMKAIRA